MTLSYEVLQDARPAINWELLLHKGWDLENVQSHMTHCFSADSRPIHRLGASMTRRLNPDSNHLKSFSGLPGLTCTLDCCQSQRMPRSPRSAPLLGDALLPATWVSMTGILFSFPNSPGGHCSTPVNKMVQLWSNLIGEPYVTCPAVHCIITVVRTDF